MVTGQPTQIGPFVVFERWCAAKRVGGFNDWGMQNILTQGGLGSLAIGIRGYNAGDVACVQDAEDTVNQALQANINMFGTGELNSERCHLVVPERLCQVDTRGKLSTGHEGRRHRACANSLLIYRARRTVS